MWTKLLRVILNLRFISRIYVSRYKGGLKEIYFSVTFTFFNKNVFLSYFTGSINKNDKQLFRRIKAQHSLFKSKSISNKKKPPPRPPPQPIFSLLIFQSMVSKILLLVISDYWSVCASECFKRIGQSVIEHALTFLYLFIQFILLLSHAGNDLAQRQWKRPWKRCMMGHHP